MVLNDLTFQRLKLLKDIILVEDLCQLLGFNLQSGMRFLRLAGAVCCWLKLDHLLLLDLWFPGHQSFYHIFHTFYSWIYRRFDLALQVTELFFEVFLVVCQPLNRIKDYLELIIHSFLEISIISIVLLGQYFRFLLLFLLLIWLNRLFYLDLLGVNDFSWEFLLTIRCSYLRGCLLFLHFRPRGLWGIYDLKVRLSFLGFQLFSFFCS